MEKLSVVLLKKALNRCDHCKEDWINNAYTHWIALGHFDDMFIYSLDCSKGFFEQIQKDKAKVLNHNDDDAYYHPLYVIPFGNANIKNDNKSIFIAIVRIHFTSSKDLTVQFKNTYDSINTTLRNNKMSFQVYYGTEFSDMVLDIRSNRLDLLAHTVLGFHDEGNIGKMYTYFGINADFLQYSHKLAHPDDRLEMFSMRFSGYNMDLIKKQIELVQSEIMSKNEALPGYYINGIDDIMLFFKDRDTSSIISLYRKWLFSENFKEYRKSESSSKIGINLFIDNTRKELKAKQHELGDSNICGSLMDSCKKISKLISSREDKGDFGWFHAISEISNSLIRMSKTPVMDEVVYLVAPGVKAFLTNVELLLEQDRINPEAPYGYLYDFAESCSYYIEQLMRIEGQLSHNPEIRPVIYDIPIFMLEYTISFLYKVSKLLKKKDKNIDSLNTVFLLVPHPCERASALEIFPVHEGIPGLVHIQIPENILYTPMELFRCLCHEISHYVGEGFRCRELRKKAYVQATVSVLTDNLFTDSDPNPAFRSMLIREFLKDLDSCDVATINTMHNILCRSALKIVESEQSICELIKRYFNFCLEEKIVPNHIVFDKHEKANLMAFESFQREIHDFDVLFREVFADICMVYLLDLSGTEYIKSLLKEIDKYPNDYNISLEIFATRIFVTLVAMNKKIEYDEAVCYSRWSQVKQVIDAIKDELESNIEGKYGLPFSVSAVLALITYAQDCYQTISEFLPQSEMIEVREMYSSLHSENFKYPYILEKIQECRANMT